MVFFQGASSLSLGSFGESFSLAPSSLELPLALPSLALPSSFWLEAVFVSSPFAFAGTLAKKEIRKALQRTQPLGGPSRQRLHPLLAGLCSPILRVALAYIEIVVPLFPHHKTNKWKS